MVVRELTAGDLGDEVLVDLIRHDDPLGVLSIYVDGDSTGAPVAAAIDTVLRASAGKADGKSAPSRSGWTQLARLEALRE